MLLQPLLVAFVPLEGPPSEHRGTCDLDQPTLAKILQTLGIISLPSKYINVEQTDRWQIGKHGSTTCRTQCPPLEGLAARPSSHAVIVPG
jgi:hypothetical protein